MRIITGLYKGRRFDVPRTFKARPTTDFAKENLFNVLQGCVDFDAAPRALDLFSGTGSITLEMLSRGCSHVTSVEKDPQHSAFIKQSLDKLCVRNALCLRTDAFAFLARCREQYDLIFADPPYALENLSELPDIILGRNLLAEDGVLVVEHGKDTSFSDHPQLFDTRSYGSVHFSLFRLAEP